MQQVILKNKRCAILAPEIYEDTCGTLSSALGARSIFPECFLRKIKFGLPVGNMFLSCPYSFYV